MKVFLPLNSTSYLMTGALWLGDILMTGTFLSLDFFCFLWLLEPRPATNLNFANADKRSKPSPSGNQFINQRKIKLPLSDQAII